MVENARFGNYVDYKTGLEKCYQSFQRLNSNNIRTLVASKHYKASAIYLSSFNGTGEGYVRSKVKSNRNSLRVKISVPLETQYI